MEANETAYPIASFTSEQLEQLTQMRRPCSHRSHRSQIFRRACEIMNLVEAFMHSGYPYACCQAYLGHLEAEMEWLLSETLQIRAEEQVERGMIRAL
ncbi:hypothetical protein N7519_001536 [Penicillium mononematosum]|uniref:uncharacterized protein n=1 Tax=Penicillium mononematosum TaxID=268346 RepID=UPI0025494CCA|nr:uncharacterized protein N7519_001536 [Penicillium mononematosum]KAJ6191515.1 hypothetical protein N7519_001536 [Penicillium mononematosum]